MRLLEADDQQLLRDIAVMQVNKAWNKGITEHSTIFRGFEDDGKSFVPIVTRAEKGGTTFTPPLYNALREGLKYLVKNGLAEATAKTTWGSDDKELTDNEKQLCRTVYEVNLSSKGKELNEIWGDAEKFIYSIGKSEWSDKSGLTFRAATEAALF